MSYEYINWALFKTKTRKATSKFVLTYLAVRADKNGYCWPSVSDMADHTLMNKKTIYTAINELKELSLITDTGKRKGHNGRVPVYRLNTTKNGSIESTEIDPELGQLNDTKNGSIEDEKVVKIESANRPKNGTIETAKIEENNEIDQPKNGSIESTQKRVNSNLIDPKTELGLTQKRNFDRPKNGSRNIPRNIPRNKLINTIGEFAEKNDLDFSCWPSLPTDQIFTDWVTLRKSKKARITQTVISSFGKELFQAAKFGFSVDQCLEECCMRNWQGFKADWIIKSQDSRAVNSHGFNPRNVETARQWLEENKS